MILWVTGIVVGGLILALWLYFSRPLNKVVHLGELGFYFGEPRLTGNLKERQIERLKRLRNVGELPPVYPNGWFCIAESNEVTPKQIKPVVVFAKISLGEQLTLVRSESGSVYLIDSYCAHMGASFNVGGKVVSDNCVQCPFHGWVFSAETGKCVRIPYDNGTIPEQAKVSTWPIVEKNKHIYVWYHCDGHDPEWEIPDIDEVIRGEWTYRGRTEHEVMCHCQEIPENGADIAHLGYLHLQIPMMGNDVTTLNLEKTNPLIHHVWNGSWKARTGDEKHISEMNLEQIFNIGKIPIGLTQSYLNAHQIGPGIVYMHFDFGLWGKGIVFHHVTPEEPLFQRVRFVMYSNMNRLFCRFFINSEAWQFERDVFVWTNKKYIRNPLLCRNDGPIQKHRRWFNQFYSDNSPRLQKDGSVSIKAKSIYDW